MIEVSTEINNFSLKQRLIELIKNKLISEGINIDKWVSYKIIIRCKHCRQYILNCYNL